MTAIREFLEWWGAGLADLVPAQLRTRLRRDRDRVVVEVQGSQARTGIVASGSNRFTPRQQCSITGPETAARNTTRAWLARRRRGPLSLRLPALRCLSKNVSLPLAAEENLGQVLGFELDRHTPYRAADVYYGFEVLQRDETARRLHVRLSVVPRSAIDSTLEQLRSALGVSPVLLELQDAEDAGLRPIPLQGAAVPRTRYRLLDPALAVIVLLLLGAALIVPLMKKRQQLEALEALADAARAEAAATGKLRDRLQSALDSSAFLAEKRGAAPLAIEVVDEVARLLPDDTWLQSLDLSNGKLSIQGQAKSATRLVELLEGSPHFHNSSFRGPIQSNPGTNTERFSLVADLRVPSASP